MGQGGPPRAGGGIRAGVEAGGKLIRFTPTDSEMGERVDMVVARRAGVPRGAARDALLAGDVTVSGRVVRGSYRVRASDVIEGDVPLAGPTPPRPQAIPVTIRYSDERVLVVSKPAGLVTHPGAGRSEGTLVNALLALGEPLAGAGTERPGIVHRLDKDTSGLLLVAKDDAARESLAGALRARRVARRYLALVRGAPPADSGTIDAPIGRHPVRRWKMAVVPGGRRAVTHYRVVAASDRASIVDVGLETGRTHQIRVHLAHLGYPVLGDRTYGGSSEAAEALGLQRLFLHAWRLQFPHPDDGRPIEVTDLLPAHLREVLERAGLPPQLP